MRAAALEQQARAAEEASQWLEKLERAITSEEGRAFRKWLKTALHREAIVDRCKRWHGPEILAVLGEVIPVETFSERAERHFGRLLLAISLGVTALSSITVIFAVSRVLPHSDEHRNPLHADASVETTVGERKVVRLPDGGSILMNASTSLAMHYMPRSRDIILLRGEARFDVRSDPARPFWVQAGARIFQVETQDATFNVYRIDGDMTELTVSRGRVDLLEPRSWTPLSPALIRTRVDTGAHVFDTGEGGTVGVNWQLPRFIPAAEAERRIAWQQQRTGSSKP